LDLIGALMIGIDEWDFILFSLASLLCDHHNADREINIRIPLLMRFVLWLMVLVTLSGCNLQSADSITPMPTPDLPRIEILSPGNNARVILGTEFDFDLVARDETAGIARVELRINDTMIQEAEPPEGVVNVFRVQMNWVAQTEGSALVEAIPYRPDGTQGDPARLILEVVKE